MKPSAQLSDMCLWIGETSSSFLMPYRKKKRRRSAENTKPSVLKKQNFECYYCDSKISVGDATWDHVIPKSKGGTRSPENLVLACKPCNSRKGDTHPGWFHKCEVFGK